MVTTDAANLLIAQVAACRATLRALQAHLARPDLDAGEVATYGLLLAAAQRDDEATRAWLATLTGIRLTPVGRWEEPWRPEEATLRALHLKRRGVRVERCALAGGLVGLLYATDAPLPLVTPVDRARARAAAEVRS